MTHAERETLPRQYAAGEIAWAALRRRGVDNYRDVLAGLGQLQLRPPVAPMDGPNLALRARARQVIRDALHQAPV